MSFIGDKAKRFGASEYCAVNFDGKVCFIEGFGRVISLGGEKIELSVAGGALVIGGAELQVEELGDGEIIVRGEIGGVYVEKNE